MTRTWPIAMSLVLSALLAQAAEQPKTLKSGVQLLVDDYLIGESQGVERKVVQPQRFLDGPIVTGALEHQDFQPFLTVLHDETNRTGKPFRMWYNVDVVDDPRDGEWFGKTGYLESADGIHWPGPYRRLNSIAEDGRVRFGASVLDEGPRHPTPAERYKMLYWDVGKFIGPRVAFSSDGLEWAVHNGGQPILPKTPSDDIWTAGYDPLRQRYFLIGKQFGPHTWTNAEGEKLTLPIRRYFTSFSPDFKTWSDPEGLVYSPDEKDSGVTQWYGSAGYQVRGDLIIGFLRELRDDRSPAGVPEEAIKANNGGGANLGANLLGERGGSGMGYTVLTWTRDGQTWHRDRYTDKFFEPDPKVGAWDHAMAWVGSAAPVGDELYLYYAGYRWGHKYHHSVDRQFGLVKIPRDRYVARQAGAEGGKLTTPLVTLDGESLALNVAAKEGEVRVQVTNDDGTPIAGFRFEDCQPIAADSLAAPVAWSESLAKLRGQAVRLEFSLKNASLFAFELR
ncbi:MAG TPA: hypothetical protein VFV87_07310 [Pirellulaceae bacterium]|nr:hypothetical protein [Pirellulaceae bacterium]